MLSTSLDTVMSLTMCAQLDRTLQEERGRILTVNSDNAQALERVQDTFEAIKAQHSQWVWVGGEVLPGVADATRSTAGNVREQVNEQKGQAPRYIVPHVLQTLSVGSAHCFGLFSQSMQPRKRSASTGCWRMQRSTRSSSGRH